MNANRRKDVMIGMPNWVGDAVMAQPALRELRRVFRNSRTVLVARPAVAGLYEGEDVADEVISIKGTTAAFAGDALLLRKRRFDLAVLLRNSFASAFLARAAGVRRVAGYATDRRGWLLTWAVPFESDYKTRHQVYYYLKIASHLSAISPDAVNPTAASQTRLSTPEPRLVVSEEQMRAGRLMLSREGVGVDRPILALNPGATNSRAKRWLPERFAEVADHLVNQNGFQTIIIGAPGDIEAAMRTKNRMTSPSLSLAGKTTIAELKRLLACCSLVISNDTGAAHLSAALGVPTVVIFGPTEHFSTRPFSEKAIVVRHDVECSPCMLRDCPIDHRCMTRVDVDEVYRAAHTMLAGVLASLPEK